MRLFVLLVMALFLVVVETQAEAGNRQVRRENRRAAVSRSYSSVAGQGGYVRSYSRSVTRGCPNCGR